MTKRTAGKWLGHIWRARTMEGTHALPQTIRDCIHRIRFQRDEVTDNYRDRHVAAAWFRELADALEQK